MKPAANQIIYGDSSKATKSWSANCIDSIITDPPYGLSFMGKEWDHGIPGVPFWREFLRITKPGGFLLCFGGPRTYHRLTCAIEDAGWEIRDCMMWLYGSGFPKSHNISKAIDKAAGAKRKVTGKRISAYGDSELSETKDGRNLWVKKSTKEVLLKNKPATPLAEIWDGYGTALKPAWEPIIVAMKPLDGTFAHNAERHGVAGLNIDKGRIGTQTITQRQKDMTAYHGNKLAGGQHGGVVKQTGVTTQTQGRWPANLILDEEAGKMLDEQSGISKSPTKVTQGQSTAQQTGQMYSGKDQRNNRIVAGHGDSGGASRFFYCAKTSRKERNIGMENCDDKLLARSGGARSAEKQGSDEYLQKHMGLNRISKVKNNHPTVKPLALMKHLCTLLKMPGQDQIILDPFMGSGTTGMACVELGIGFIGIEKEREYCEIAQKRIAAILGKTLPITKNVETFRATTDFAGGGRRPNENPPRISESRQSIINAAVAAIKEKRK